MIPLISWEPGLQLSTPLLDPGNQENSTSQICGRAPFACKSEITSSKASRYSATYERNHNWISYLQTFSFIYLLESERPSLWIECTVILISTGYSSRNQIFFFCIQRWAFWALHLKALDLLTVNHCDQYLWHLISQFWNMTRFEYWISQNIWYDFYNLFQLLKTEKTNF